jgi:hypothetical protein
VKWEDDAGKAEQAILSPRPLVARIAARAAAAGLFRLPEPVEAIGRLIASFANDVYCGTQNDDLSRCAILIEQVRELSARDQAQAAR